MRYLKYKILKIVIYIFTRFNIKALKNQEIVKNKKHKISSKKQINSKNKKETLKIIISIKI